MRGERQNQNQTRNNDLPHSRALGIIILMFALLLFQVGVFVFEKVFRDDAQNPAPPASGSSVPVPSVPGAQHELFKFDPNTICPDSLCLLGFSQKQAESIVKYRNKGGKFHKKEDFARMYVVSEEKYAELEPYILVSEQEAPETTAHRRAVPDVIKTGAPAVKQPVKQDGLQAGRQTGSLTGGIKPVATEQNTSDATGRKAAAGRKPQLLIDINVADSAAFTRLYGIGGYYARKIIAYRERLGNFYSTAQLMEIPGIDSVRFEGFARNITADPAAVRYFSLDTAGKYFLMRHPYVGAYAARGILLMREKLGAGACTIDNLVKERIISPQMAEKLWHYISDSSF